jgi:hypothetical protein
LKVTGKPILLVEDGQVDTMTVIRALNEIHVMNQVVHRKNGEDALNYLKDETNDRPASFCST